MTYLINSGINFGWNKNTSSKNLPRLETRYILRKIYGNTYMMWQISIHYNNKITSSVTQTMYISSTYSGSWSAVVTKSGAFWTQWFHKEVFWFWPTNLSQASLLLVAEPNNTRVILWLLPYFLYLAPPPPFGSCHSAQKRLCDWLLDKKAFSLW